MGGNKWKNLELCCFICNVIQNEVLIFEYVWSNHKKKLHYHHPIPASRPPHLDGVGVVLRAAHHAGGSVEAGRGLEGDCEVVGLRDVLHGGGAGVGLHEGRELERQHQREQLLQYGGRGQTDNHQVSANAASASHLNGC